jgi:hypothetical protein
VLYVIDLVLILLDLYVREMKSATAAVRRSMAAIDYCRHPSFHSNSSQKRCSRTRTRINNGGLFLFDSILTGGPDVNGTVAFDTEALAKCVK